MITFQKILPDGIADLPVKAIHYLQQAINRTPASTSRLDVTLDIARKGYGNMYAVYDERKLTGMCYLLLYDSPEGKIASPCLIGGDNMRIWKRDFHKFLYEFCQLSGAIKCRWIGRKGWAGAYPKSKVIGYIMEHEISPPQDN